MDLIYTCQKKWSEIPFTHRQSKHEGRCKFVHGHDWSVRVVFACRQRDRAGFIVDFGGTTCKAIKADLDRFDHAFVLSEDDPILESVGVQDLMDRNALRLVLVPDCSCEGLADYFLHLFQAIVDREEGARAWVQEVTVYEDSRNSATAFRVDTPVG